MSRIRNEDLVLKVSEHIDPDVWEEGKYYAFVDRLCGQREYQKEAIFTALRFLAGATYPDLRTLAIENYEENQKLQEVYSSWEVMENKLQFPRTTGLYTGPCNWNRQKLRSLWDCDYIAC